MRKTPEQIRTHGLAALRKCLGRAGMIRFLQQVDNGAGDYVRERQRWIDHTSLDDIRAASISKSRRRSARRAAKP